MERLALPSLDMDGFLECIKQLVRLDESWVPNQEGYSMYIRPTAIGTSPFLGVHASESLKLFVILSPVGPYYKGGFKPIKLFADVENARAWPGGVGNAKVCFVQYLLLIWCFMDDDDDDDDDGDDDDDDDDDDKERL